MQFHKIDVDVYFLFQELSGKLFGEGKKVKKFCVFGLEGLFRLDKIYHFNSNSLFRKGIQIFLYTISYLGPKLLKCGRNISRYLLETICVSGKTFYLHSSKLRRVYTERN